MSLDRAKAPLGSQTGDDVDVDIDYATMKYSLYTNQARLIDMLDKIYPEIVRIREVLEFIKESY